MDAFVKWMSKRLAAQSSRRGFFSAMGKAVLGAAALVTGQGFFAQAAEAVSSLHCCSGRACSHYYCPRGSSVHYTWVCHSSRGYYTCNDCYYRGRFVCTYSTYR